MFLKALFQFAFTPWPVAAASAGVLAGLLGHVTPYMLLASVNYFTLLLGVTLRHRAPAWHGRLMTAAILSDLSLVLALQWQRHAVQTAASFTLSPLQQTHILCSSVAAVLYFPMLYLGYRLHAAPAAERGRWRPTHERCGTVALIFRSLGFLLMFSMLKASP